MATTDDTSDDSGLTAQPNLKNVTWDEVTYEEAGDGVFIVRARGILRTGRKPTWTAPQTFIAEAMSAEESGKQPVFKPIRAVSGGGYPKIGGGYPKIPTRDQDYVTVADLNTGLRDNLATLSLFSLGGFYDDSSGALPPDLPIMPSEPSPKPVVRPRERRPRRAREEL